MMAEILVKSDTIDFYTFHCTMIYSMIACYTMYYLLTNGYASISQFSVIVVLINSIFTQYYVRCIFDITMIILDVLISFICFTCCYLIILLPTLQRMERFLEILVDICRYDNVNTK